MQQEQISLNKVYSKLLQLEIYMRKMDKYMEDLEFARQTEEAWQEIDAGKGKTYSLEAFKKRLRNG